MPDSIEPDAPIADVVVNEDVHQDKDTRVQAYEPMDEDINIKENLADITENVSAVGASILATLSPSSGRISTDARGHTLTDSQVGDIPDVVVVGTSAVTSAAGYPRSTDHSRSNIDDLSYRQNVNRNIAIGADTGGIRRPSADPEVRTNMKFVRSGSGRAISEHHTSMSNSIGNQSNNKRSDMRIPRDYLPSGCVKFMTVELDEANVLMVPEDTLYGTVERINEIFVEAEKVNFDTVFDALMGFLTFYLWFRLKESTYGKQLRILDEFIAQENHRKYRPLGLELTNPLDTGLRYILIRSL